MNNALLHAMNKTQTFIDVESGSFISLPKDGTDKPPVNADINNNVDTLHSTGGEGTPDNSIPLVNVSSWNKTVCGKNLFNINTLTNKYNVNTTITDNDITVTATSIGTFRRVQSTNFTLPAGTYYLHRDFEIISGTGIGGTGRTILYEAGTTNSIRNNNGSFTLLNTTEVYLALYLNTASALVDLLSVRFYNIQIERSSSYTGWKKYTGKSYPYRYRLEDTDGNLHYGGDLPDGTADTYNRETGEFVERKGVKVLGGVTETWTLGDVETGYTTFTTPLETGSNSLRCSHFPTVLTDNNLISCDGTTLTLQINTTVLPTQTVQALNTWLGNNPVTVQYALAEPVTYTIKQYGETYGGVVWEYNEKPKSIQYHTNIFTDKNIDIQCEVRKLGNRKMGEFYWVTENGDKITTEDGDYIMLEY